MAKQLKLYVLLLCLCIPLFFISTDGQHDWGGDFSQYIHQAKNIVEGKPLQATGFEIGQYLRTVGPPTYPSGLPLFLSPAYAAFGMDLQAFQIVNTIFLVILVLVLFKYLQLQQLPIVYVFIATIAFVYLPSMLGFKRSIITEIPFLLFSFAFFALYDLWKQKKSFSLILLAGFMLGCSTLIKSVGIITVFALAIERCIYWIKSGARINKLRDEIPVLVLIVISILVPLLAHKVLFPEVFGTSSFYGGLIDVKRAILQLPYAILVTYRDFASFFFPGLGYTGYFLALPILLICLKGFIVDVKNKISVVHICIPLYIIVVLLWPFHTQGFRYLFPIIPFFLLFLYRGYQSISLFQKSKLKLTSLILVALLFVIAHLFSPLKSTFKTSPTTHNAKELFRYVRQNISKEHKILFEKPRVLNLWTGRKGLTNHQYLSPDTIPELIRKYEVDYVITSEIITNDSLKKYVQKHSKTGILTSQWNNEEFTVYKINQ